MDEKKLTALSRLIRYYILASTTKAGSGHPTSALSGVELMAGLFFGGIFRTDLNNPKNPNNDRLIFSKGHASPLFYSLYAAAGKISEPEMMTYRQFSSPLEGHPTPRFRYTEASTGSLGQGLSIGVGMALNAKYLDQLGYRTYVLLGDSEMAEGSQWEAIQLAAYYQLDNLVAILDVNRLGQRGETMDGYQVKKYQKRFDAFGWKTIVIDGHSYPQVIGAYQQAIKSKGRPIVIIAKTVKGKGVSFLENKDGFHGKTLSPEQFNQALAELGSVNKKIIGQVLKVSKAKPKAVKKVTAQSIGYDQLKPVATRKAFGLSLARLGGQYPEVVSLDAETSNSTYAELFKAKFPKRFFEMFIAEQNMVGNALGLSLRGKIPFVSTFAAFFSRAFDQIRMSQYSTSNIKFVGSHAGVSIGEDGPSQMALEDIAMFRSLIDSVVLYPSDAIATEKLVEQAIKHQGNVYIRTTRKETPLIYKTNEAFLIGGSKVLRQSSNDKVTIVAAGVTLYEALAAADALKSKKINVRVVDLYSIKPIDLQTLKLAAQQTGAIITVEDHGLAGGLGEAVKSALAASGVKIYALAVNKIPRSGKPDELMAYENISAQAIISLVKKIIIKK
ncbi:MAG: transketolase [Patescibacteria group bacterium]|nr:transketolase [Patescibacteria group bacterium]